MSRLATLTLTSRRLPVVKWTTDEGTGSMASSRPWLLEYRSSTTFVVAVVCLAIFTDIFFYGLVVPVIPFSIAHQAGVPEAGVQKWTAILLACYSAALFVGAPLVGVYADHMSSRRQPLLLGLFALGSATLLLCLGRSIVMLVLGRLLQGLSAAIVWSVGLALLVDTVGSKIGYAMGFVGTTMSVGMFIAPLVGGAVYSAAGYYAVYYLAFAVLAADIVMRLVLVEKKVASRWLNDTEKAEGHAMSTQAEHLSQRLPDEPGRVRHPHWELVRTRRILAALFGISLVSSVVFSLDTVLPLFVKARFSWSSSAAGMLFMALTMPGFLSPLAGLFVDRYGARWITVGGFTLAIPLLVCLRFVDADTTDDKVLLCTLLATLGVTFLAMINTPLMAEISYAIEAREAAQPGLWGAKGVYGIAYGLSTTAYALGGTVGSVAAGFLQDGPGWGSLTWVLAILSGVGGVGTLWVGGRPERRTEQGLQGGL